MARTSGSDRCVRLIAQSSAAAAARPSACRQRVDHKILQPRVPARRQELQDFDQAGEGDDEGRREQPVARVGQSEGQPQQHKGKRMLAVLSEVRMRPLFRRPERRKGDGGGKAPGE